MSRQKRTLVTLHFPSMGSPNFLILICFQEETQLQRAKRQLFQMASVVVSIVNRTVFDSPTERAEKTGGHDMLYEEMYKRWFLYCHLPNICRTLPHYFPVNIFNVQFLLDVRDQIYDRLQQFGCNRIPADIQLRDDLLTFFQEMMGAMHGGDLDVIRGHVAPENVQDQKDLVELRRATGKHMKPIVEEEIRFVQK
ncbi:histone acetyltransferase KAT2A-like [Periplaneta americana]|uniref:histone acetyltransferase KAT2A-like n=1 Tax=Periplaneta americana TaxID=6978 RepID=UPI0037E7BA25